MNYFHGFLNNIKRFRIFYWAGAQTLTLAPSLCHNMKRELKKRLRPYCVTRLKKDFYYYY